MTRDEIIKLASQAIDDTRSEVDLPVPFVLRFANLVIADFLAQTGQYVTNDASREAAIKKAVDAERDACAQIVQSECIGFAPEDDQLNCIVAAIRARSIQPPKGGD